MIQTIEDAINEITKGRISLIGDPTFCHKVSDDKPWYIYETYVLPFAEFKEWLEFLNQNEIDTIIWRRPVEITNNGELSFRVALIKRGQQVRAHNFIKSEMQ